MIWVSDDEDEAENDETRSSEAQTSEKIDWERSSNSINFKWIFYICLLIR